MRFVVGRRALRLTLLHFVLVLMVACRPAPQPVAPPPQSQAATRIVTLAPHLAELVVSAGAGERLVGVVEFSDFPPEASELPRVGDAFRVDFEAMAALRPDLVLGWGSGNQPETLQRLRDLGFRVVTFEPVEIDDIATHIEAIGALAGTSGVARTAAAQFRARLERLGAGFDAAVPVTVFVQLSERPYFTVTDQHFLGQGLRRCGGRNVFGSLPGLTATVSLESVIEAAPDVIIASDMGGNGESPLEGWRSWRDLPAVRRGNLFTVDADLLSRPSLRILDGIEQLCGLLGQARQGTASR